MVRPTAFSLKTNSGSTLVELMVSVAVGSIVMASVADISVGLIRNKVKFENNMGSIFEANILTKKLKNKIYMGGGNGIAPWQSLNVENNCVARDWFPNCNGTDRLTTATNHIDISPTQKVFTANVPVFGYDVGTGTITVFNPAAPVAPCTVDPSKFSSHIMLVDPGTNQVTVRWVKNVDTTNCVLQTERDLQGAVLDRLDGVNNTFINATMYAVELNTFYLDPGTNQIMQLTTSTNNTVLATGDLSIVTSNIYDFQVALGYDVAPKNLIVTDKGTVGDEVLYNAVGDLLNNTGGVGAQLNDLQSLMMAFAIGSRQPGHTDTVQNFDGPPVSKAGFKLISFKETFTFRNLMSYQ